MKCFKKVAALLFCVALALSVMAVAAFADDEAVLLDMNEQTGVVENTLNRDFTVMLTKNDSAIPNSRDDVSGYEIVPSDTVTFDITMAYSGTAFAGKTIDAFQFEFNPGNNYGAEIQQVIVKHLNGSDTTTDADVTTHSASNYFDSTGNYENTYSFDSGDPLTDIALPGSTALALDADTDKATGGSVIGSITLKFNHATQAINIYPQIENLLIHVRNSTESAQIPVAAQTVNETAYGADIAGTITNGKTVTYVPDGGSSSVTSPSSKGSVSTTCVIVAPIPVIVNPIYNVTVVNFRNNPTTGIAEKVTDASNENPVYQYDFLTGTFGSENSNYEFDNVTTALPTTSLYGYTLQGWMVTTDSNTSPTWKTWGEYDTNHVTWDETRSFPETTTAQNGASTGYWGASDSWKLDTTNKIEWVAPFMYSTSNLNQANVNFIEVDKNDDNTPKNYTTFPAGLVGNITLTPVYTRDVYTATFDSGDDDATFGNSFTATQDTNEPKHWIRTYEYTIEDLTVGKAVNGAVYDFLTLDDTDGETALQYKDPANTAAGMGNAAGPQGLTRKAYKFMGWTPVSDSTVIADYKWQRDGDPTTEATTELVPISSYESTEVLKTANCKHYGNVRFTAVWEEDIYYAEIAYQYAGTNNVLVLVGVPSGENDNYNKDYTYLFEPSSGLDAQTMFYVPAGTGQKAAYADATKSGSGTGVTEAFPTAGLTGDYVLFAYIAAPADVTENSVTIDEAESYTTAVSDATLPTTGSTCGNYVLSYNGDIDNSNSITVVDFGNVDTLLNSALATDTGNVFTITNYFGVRARLQADVHTESGTDIDQLRAFASIKDVRTIYDKMGYNSMGN